MEIKITTKQLLLVLQILCWIIFVGLCVEAGGIIFNAVYALFKPVVAQYFWNRADFSDLYQHDKGQFLVQTGFMTIVALMKVLIFYLLIQLFVEKKLDFSKPFTPYLSGIMIKIAYLCLGAGLFSLWGTRYASWFQSQGIRMPEISILHMDGGDVWIFMAVVLFVLGQIFKKGIALQTENDLTV